MMKKILALLMAMVFVCTMLAGCGTSTPQETEETSEAATIQPHKIAVVSYSATSAEMVAFRNYLDNYITSVFEGVTFMYSDVLNSASDEQRFLQEAADAGAEGVLSFLSYDLVATMNLCSAKNMYYIMASGSVPDDAFEQVKNNTCFLGTVGPSVQAEMQAGADMVDAFADKVDTNRFIIFSGGAGQNNVMHQYRMEGILDELKTVFGDYGEDLDALAVTKEQTSFGNARFTATIVPGYLESAEVTEAATAILNAGEYDYIASTVPVVAVQDSINIDACVGIVDCYTEENSILFNSGKLDFLAGKYGSIIGPSFVALYNAVCGYAREYKDKEAGFMLEQGFWCSKDVDDFNEKYALGSGIASNAYDFSDLVSVCKLYNPDTNLEELKALVEAYDYESVLNRRGQ